MAEKLDPRQVVTFEELIRGMIFETEATRNEGRESHPRKIGSTGGRTALHEGLR